MSSIAPKADSTTARLAESVSPDTVRVDFVPKHHYISPDFLRLEKERLWPRVWQIACREQDLPHVGSFFTYDIMDESIVVVRTTPTELKAFFNACQHRGRRLTEGAGVQSRFHCRFHGWQYNLDGSNARIVDRDDWAGCPNFTDRDVSLKEVQVGTWGGWVYVNMDPNAEPLADFLAPVPQYLDPYELQKMKYRWHATVKVPCNWKVALEAFSEAYHVSATHPQMMDTYGDDTTHNQIFGRHGKFFYLPNPDFPLGGPSPRIGKKVPTDLRQNVVDYFQMWNDDLGAFFTERDAEAAHRVLTEVSPTASSFEILGKAIQFQAEAAIASGAGWPDMTLEQMMAAMTDWHVFPNYVMLPWPSGLLAYRALPHPTDPNWCYFDVYSLARFAPGLTPKYERKLFLGDEDWRNFKSISVILQQDFDNMKDVQRGMHSHGFGGARTNPKQEATISNFHRVICEYVEKAPAR